MMVPVSVCVTGWSRGKSMREEQWRIIVVVVYLGEAMSMCRWRSLYEMVKKEFVKSNNPVKNSLFKGYI